MKRSRHTAAAMATALALLVSGCSGGVTENHPGEKVKPPAAVSSTFNQYAIWSSSADGSIRPVVSGDSVVYMVPTGKDVYTISAVNNTTGNTQWTGTPQEIPDTNNGSPIGLYAFTSKHRPYVAVVIPLPDDKAVRVDIYDPQRSGLDAAPTSVLKFQGADTPPVVVPTTGGVIINGVKGNEQHILDPATGTSERFIGTLDRATNSEKTTERMWAFYGDAALAYWSNGGYSYRGRSGGWSSDNHEPSGAQHATGVLLAANNGYLVSRWNGAFVKQEIIAVQDIYTGRIVAKYEHTTDEPATPDQTAITASRDGKWVTWKNYAFDVKMGTGRVMVSELDVTAISDGIVYGTRRKAPVQFDIVTGGSSLLKAKVPRVFTDNGGIFTTTNDAKATMFAATLRRQS